MKPRPCSGIVCGSRVSVTGHLLLSVIDIVVVAVVFIANVGDIAHGVRLANEFLLPNAISSSSSSNPHGNYQPTRINLYKIRGNTYIVYIYVCVCTLHI